MKIYKAIIWFSVLFVIGEALILSGFEFIPPYGALQGQILGAKTSQLLTQLEEQLYPASYYNKSFIEQNLKFDIPKTSAKVQEKSNQEKQEIKSQKKNQSKSADIKQEKVLGQKIEKKIETVNQEVDQMINLLNSSVSGDDFYQELNDGYQQNQANRVNVLINKNKRFYLEKLKKQLNQISQGL